jgi:transcriptional regulator with XRE-family HTH domain
MSRCGIPTSALPGGSWAATRVVQEVVAVGRTSPTFRKRRLSRRLREMRERTRMTIEEAAKRLDLSTSTLSRVEKGESAANVHLVRSMMDLYDHYDEALIPLAREARKRGWWQAYGIAAMGYVGMETEAAVVRNHEIIYVPGLLQTADYARALLRSGKPTRTDQQLENQVQVRTIRQERLTDPESPLELAAIVDEAALHRMVGGPEIMRTQLGELINRADLETVTLQVLPLGSGAHCGMNGAFAVLGFNEPDEPELLYIEHTVGSLHLENVKEVHAARLVHDDLRTAALSPPDSVALIEKLLGQL